MVHQTLSNMKGHRARGDDGLGSWCNVEITEASAGRLGIGHADRGSTNVAAGDPSGAPVKPSSGDPAYKSSRRALGLSLQEGFVAVSPRSRSDPVDARICIMMLMGAISGVGQLRSMS